ncbi:MAG: FG-GAP-like repeat-containing protein [Polyangiales bacterium]
MWDRAPGSRLSASWFAWFVWFAVLVGGCTSSVPEGQCEFDVQCGGGQVCVDHYCRAQCRQDSDCPASYRCRPGDATGSGSGCVPTRMAMPCVRDSECAAGQACLQGECRAQCRQDYDCLALNPFNRCLNGACVLSCQPRVTDNCDRAAVNGCEVRIDQDPSHCGACGRACPGAAHATGGCAAGECHLACDEGWADCDGLAANGCEADLSRAESCGACGVRCAAPRGLCAEVTDGSGATSYACTDRCVEPTPDRCGDTCTRRATDVANCGTCGAACPTGPRAEAVCAAGACSIRCTDPRYADCDRAGANGCEADLETSAAHCGACGRACPAGPHATAACAGGACALVCEAGWADCDGSAANGCEADLRGSAEHCGMCSRQCPGGADARCDAGACRTACMPARGDCDGDAANGCETDLTVSAQHCGACGTRCAFPGTGARCAAGRCEPTGMCSSATLGDCDGNAANGCESDLTNSLLHCGACGNACSLPNATPVCADGRCRVGSCNAGFADCDANPSNGCEVALATSPDHCGACGNACPRGHGAPSCAAGACRIACDAGYGDCDGVAANGCETSTATSTTHCGACGRACAPANAVGSCSSGRCGVGTCNAGFADCDGDPANGCEVNLATSAAHCGACGRACSAAGGTPSCAMGVCGIACSAGFGDCDRSAANGCETALATSLAHCGACGAACSPPSATGACVAGACRVAACNPGRADCDGAAANGCEVDLATSAAHCGACGAACMAGWFCAGGACARDCGALTACGAACVDLRTSPSNCGRCGNACSFANAAAVCAAGACGLGACNAGFGNCDGNPANGCETALATSPSNCGACGNACNATNGTATCAAGVCGITCAAGFGNCDGSAANGCEVNLASTAAHCGACGRACSLPNATASCAAGACGVASCNAGFGNCDGNPANGCEANLATTAAHCGACGRACSLPNATAACSAGGCVVASCNAGFGDCDGDPANGCEVNLRTTAAHCGRCGGACSVPNATAACVAGACAVGACNTDFADCDGAPANGCEVNLATSNANCGACGRACATGQVCSARVCASICAPPTTYCGGRCFDLQTDPSNCGACGTACPARANATPACARGGCGFTCNAGFGDCDGVAANGCEAALATSPSNCGACGTACNATNGAATCAGGVCGITCNAGFGNCDGSAANGCEVALATSTAHCGACGNACSLANATPACAAGACAVASCNAGFGNCDGNPANGCETNTGTSPSNCGACGNACNATNGTATCAAAACGITCNAGFGNCDGLAANGCETNTNTTVAHCGGCGRVCSLPNAAASCAAGACAVSVCSAGFGNCDGVAANGCEANLATSSANCGACGRACATGFICSASVCVRSCSPPTTNCSNVCVDLQADASNCGGCGVACSFPNATPACAAGACAIGSCNAGFGNCDAMTPNGCETSTSTSVAHCGACNNACSFANAAASCVSGRCTLGACNAGFGDCDGAAANGCEANFATSVSNCGGCGVVCSAPTNGTAACSSSRCTQSCNPGYYAIALGAGIVCAPLPAPPQVAPGSFMSATSRRPTFRWVVGGPINGARLQVCSDRACATRLIDVTVTGTTYTPTADLPTGRLWWRLFGRAGTNEGATASPVWQVFVPALTAARSSAFGVVLDVNGDGYTDAAVGSTGLTAFVYHGSATGLGASPARTYTGATGSDFGVSVSAAGDVNGDGYGDLIIGAPGLEAAYIYYGSATGLGAPTTIPSPAIRSGFGASVSWAGDVNDDGYGDVIVGACWTACANAAYVFLGSSSGLSTTPVRTLTVAGATGFGRFVQGLGEVNNDALDDVAVVAGTLVYVFPGAAPPVVDTLSLANFAGVAYGGDTNGDGYADVATVTRTIISAQVLTLRVYYGSAGGLGAARPFTSSSGTIGYGTAVAGIGDVDGDGYGEIAWSTQGTNVRVVPGSAAGPNIAAAITVPATAGRGGFGESLSGVGDTNGDGRWDLLVGEPDFATEFVCAHYVRLFRGSAAGVAATPVYSITLPAGGSCADFGSDLAP